MNFSSYIPLLAIFELEGALIESSLYRIIQYPCSIKNGKVIDSKNVYIDCYPEVSAVFEKLKKSNIELAIINCPYNDTKYDLELINLFGWDKYVSYTEINKVDNSSVNIVRIQEKSKIPLNQMIHFACKGKQWFVSVFLINNEIVTTINIYREIGLTVEVLDKALHNRKILLQQLEIRYNITTEAPEDDTYKI